ncbi:HD-GYP domain-containing protein [Aminipila sp.]|uniref:HD-GYP domain-containing protein n=1 Tax=Aminipila sp. TaxID=2060095 RepID=UPI00289EE809|nr:HD domain-containing phosphohydrolase [Aminipila sp.]
MEVSIYSKTDIEKIIQSLPKDTVEHMHRVGILVSMIALKLYDLNFYTKNFNKDEYKYFGEAATYHDIGKAWIPKNILIKPGKLTKEEAINIYKHPEFARRLFHQINDGSISGMPKHLTKLAFNSAVFHHEWWNGKGYPYRISLDNIPLIARITSICDAYDAITNPRSYRKANTHLYACHELESNAGTQFDPSLVQIFLDSQQELSVIKGTAPK